MDTTTQGFGQPKKVKTTGRAVLARGTPFTGMSELYETWRAARETWPEVDIDPAVYADYLASREAGPCTADLYLACACSRGDTRALAAFDARVLSVIDPALGKLGIGADVVGEVKQRLRTSLLVGDGEGSPPRILQFNGKGDLRGWVRVIAVREALALGAKDRRFQPLDDDSLAERLLPDSDPELAHLKRFYSAEFKAAFASALGALEDRERLLLRQQFIDGLTIDEVGALYRVHRATAARWMERARTRVMESTLAELRRRLAVGPAELDSILRLIRSQLEVSMGPLAGGGRRGRDLA
jgi:RNA polymerase sigma-70 factor (ECF subfamily)